MKHTDFYRAIQAIEELAKAELVEALQAHGGEFTIPNSKESELPELIIVGAFKHSEGSEDILFTRAKIDENKGLYIYGKSYKRQYEPEEQIEFLEDGYLHFILDIIPDTIHITDTRNKYQNEDALRKMKEALGRSV